MGSEPWITCRPSSYILYL